MLTPGEQWVDYVGLDEHPQAQRLADEANDAIFDAVEALAAVWRDEDPLAALMLDWSGALGLWQWVPAGVLADLRPGRRVRLRGAEGVVLPPRDGWYLDGPGTALVRWQDGSTRLLRPERPQDWSGAEHLVPVPVDLGALAGR